MPKTLITSSWKESGYEGDLAFKDSSGDIIFVIENSTRSVIFPTGAALTVTDGISSTTTLDQAYDTGGAGAGKAVTVDSGAIALTNNAANNNGILTVTKNPTGAQSGDAVTITVGAQSTGTAITIANTGSGNDITGSGSTWSVTKAGVGTFDSFSVGQITLTNDTLPAGTSCYIGRDNTGDVTINSLTGKTVNLAVAGTDVVTVAGTAITLAQAVTVSTGGIAVTGASSVTGNVTVTGDLEVTGAFTFGGALTINDTVTVDELILDTDGTAPAGTNAYVVSDNTGDLTLNALTGKQVLLAIAGTDEYGFGAAALDMNANALDNCGYVILNAATAPAGTEVYVVHDNTGDLTVNAKTGKSVLVSIAGTDEYTFNATAFIVASGNNIQFAGNNGLIDSNGNEVIMVEAVGSATTYLNVKNANGGNVVLECLGANDLGFTFANDQDEEVLILTPVATAVNEFTLKNAATGAKPIIMVSGEADIGLQIQNAAGEKMLETESSSAPVNWLNIGNADTGVAPFIESAGEDDIGMMFQAKNNEEILILAATAAAVNEITITSKDTGNSPIIAATGDDADIDLVLTSKGTGLVQVSTNGLDMATNPIYGGTGANENLLLHSTENATKGYVGIPTGHEGLKIGGTADRAGTVGDNALHIFNGAAAPAGALANGCTFYSEGGEMKVLDAAGNSTTISPHTKDGDYVIHSFSANKKETVTIHLEKLVNALVEGNPELAKYVTYGDGVVKSPKAVK